VEISAQIGHVYGPVWSRRLGRSLGLDVAPYKTCTFDCVYCQLGQTTVKTLGRAPYVQAWTVLNELSALHPRELKVDYITVSASGEPTLNSEVGELIAGCRRLAPQLSLAVLTNGSLLWQEEVRESVAGADLLVPSLDAARQETFERVNRPAEGLTVEKIVEGLKAARDELDCAMWLEIMLVAGCNDTEEDLAALRDAVAYINPHKVHLNTVVRPPAEVWAQPLEPADLAAAAEAIGHGTEVIVTKPAATDPDGAAGDARVLELLRRRPCAVRDIADGLGMHPNEVTKSLRRLLARGEIKIVQHGGGAFYSAT